MKLTILSTEGAQDSEFRSFFGRIQDATICFRDLLTFTLEAHCSLYARKLVTSPGFAPFFLVCCAIKLHYIA